MGNSTFILTGPALTETTLEVDPPSFGASGFVARAVMPIEPTPSVPTYSLDGQRAQTEVVSRAANGWVDAVEIIGWMTGSSGTIGLGGSDPGATIYNPDLSGIGLSMKLANVTTPVVADITTGVAKTCKDGDWINETRYWSRFTNGTETVAGCHFYVERRADVNVVLVTVRISNAVCHPGAGNAQITNATAYSNENPTVDGDIYFDHIEWTGLPVGWSVVADVERDSMNTVNGYVVKPYANTTWQHVLPARCEFVRRYALCEDGLVSQASELLALYGVGRCSGADSYQNRFAWGPNKSKLPLATSAYTFNAETGMDAVEAKRAQDVATLTAAYQAGTDSGGVGLEVGSDGGWQHPLGDSSDSNTGGAYIGYHGWPYPVRSEIKFALLTHASNMERMACGVLHPDTGEVVTTHDLANACQVPGHEGKQPWDIKASSGGRPLFDIPWLVASYCPDSFSGADKLLPTTRAWNSKDDGHTCPYESRARWQLMGGSYQRYDDQHLVRFLITLPPCLWHINDSCSRDNALEVAAYAQCAQTPYRIRHRRSSNSGSVADDLDSAMANPFYGSGIARAAAHKTQASLIAHCIGSPEWRSANETFWDLMADNFYYRAAPVLKTTQRIGYPNSNGPNPHTSYGTPDLVNRTGSAPRSVADGGSNATTYTCCQAYEMFFVNHAAFCQWISVHRGNDSVRASRMAAHVQGYVTAAFQNAETTPGNYTYNQATPGMIPRKFLVVNDDEDAAPASAFIPWAFFPGQAAGAYPGQATTADVYHGLEYAYRVTGDTFFLDRAAQATGFSPSSYTNDAVADDFIASLLSGFVFQLPANEAAGIAGLFQSLVPA